MANNDWNAENLNDAYRKGYFVGLSGRHQERCPYVRQVILAAAWEAGWHDGLEAAQEWRSSRSRVRPDSNSRRS